MSRWTKRRDGTVRTTVVLKLHVPRDLVDWLIEHSEITSQAQALQWVRRNVGHLTDEWRVLACDTGGFPHLVHADGDEGSYHPEQDFEHIYEGPEVIVR